MPPSGDTPEVVHAYWDWLFNRYLQDVPTPRTDILWSSIIWIFTFGLILVAFFIGYTSFFRNATRKKGEIYGITSFAGNILERIGKVSIASMVLYVFLFLWALSYVVRHIIWGQIY